MKKRFILNTITSLVMQITAVISGFILPRLLMVAYGSEVNGLTHSISQFLGVITFLEFGIGQVIQSSLYKHLVDKDNVKISQVVASGTKFFKRIAYILVTYVLILVCVYPAIVNNSFKWSYTATLIGAISINSFAQYYFGAIDSVFLSADQRGYIQYTSQIVAIVLNTVLSAALIRFGCSIQIVKTCASVIFLIRPLFVRVYINKRYKLNRRIKYEGEPIKQKWNAVAQHFSAIVLDGTDTIVLTLFSTLSNVSVYSVYFMVIAGIKQLYEAVTAGLHSMVGNLWAKRDLEKLKKLFSGIEIGLHSVVVFLFCCIGILIVPFVKVYTNGLTDADYIQPVFATILTLAYGIRCLRTPYNILILAGGHYKQTQRCHIIAAVLNLSVSIVTVWMWGLVGVAIGTLVALTYQTVWMAIYDSKNLLNWHIGNFIKHIAVDALTAALIYFATSWINLSDITYIAWFVMALKVTVIAGIVTVAMSLAFYKKQVVEMIRWFSKRKLIK